MEGACARELNGVLVRAVGSSGSTARRRLPARFSIGRMRDSGAGRALERRRGKRKTKIKTRNEKYTHIRTLRRARKIHSYVLEASSTTPWKICTPRG